MEIVCCMIGGQMDTFHNNEETYYVYEDKDIREILEDKLGRDFAEYIMSRIEEADAEAIYAERRLKTDLNNYEASCEIFQNAIMDAIEALDRVMQMNNDKPRLRKEVIIQEIWQIRRDLHLHA